MTQISVLIVGIILIVLITWWFFGKHQVETKEAKMEQSKQIIDIKVDGGYSPEQVIVKKGIPTELRFTKLDNSSCLDHVVFPDFGINQALPQDQTTSIMLNTEESGEFEWSCGMNMFHGKLIVK
ncbi:cupredoxin domain-containing protein [Weissella coleopterorum]|uniref:Cupredoxin domain-containing protein n=1 Tax=Weissella coleopterorum TaxID=2714949 RepID=A0A6G8B0H1_9LACO|nr:cupredoxin domain-containing protein [Weissella coleopterorum]QIL50737.1 cupredoxin domain-containing protein [Weissella coleopterorum]